MRKGHIDMSYYLASELLSQMLLRCPKCKKPLETVGLSGFNCSSRGEAWVECENPKCAIEFTLIIGVTRSPLEGR